MSHGHILIYYFSCFHNVSTGRCFRAIQAYFGKIKELEFQPIDHVRLYNWWKRSTFWTISWLIPRSCDITSYPILRLQCTAYTRSTYAYCSVHPISSWLWLENRHIVSKDKSNDEPITARNGFYLPPSNLCTTGFDSQSQSRITRRRNPSLWTIKSNCSCINPNLIYIIVQIFIVLVSAI